ncbi:MAG: hypothetical protein AAFQ94_22870 [Bacteroidota bacterium]
MKKLPLLKSAMLAVFCGLLMTGCIERNEGLDVRPADPVFVGSLIEAVDITTDAPDVTSTQTVFNGAVSMDKDKEIEVVYGFFWYDPNDKLSEQNPNRIEVGVASGSFEFTSDELTDLPRERELIVCAFVERDNRTEMNVGDEVPFTVPKP